MIRVSEPVVTDADIRSVVEVLKQGFLSGESPPIEAFEKQVASATNRRCAVAVSSGSAALDVLWSTTGIGPGDEVIVPSFSIASTIFQIVRAGATPVFVDVDRGTWNTTPEQIRMAISSRTRAVLAVHTYGLPVDMPQVLQLSSLQDIPVYEDAAEAHGLLIGGRLAGSFGKASILSFYANKNVSSGEGGMLLTNDEATAAEARSLRNLSFSREQRFVHHRMGWNYRMSALQAALGASQFGRLDETIAKRRLIGEWYRDRLEDLEELDLATPKTHLGLNDYWVFGTVLNESAKVSRQQVVDRLLAKGVETRPFFHPLHQQPFLSDSPHVRASNLAVTEFIGARGFYLPNGLAISESTIDKICSILRGALRG
jgi:perosamine synthetase